MDKIPNSVDHRRNFAERKKAGLVAKNPPRALAPSAVPPQAKAVKAEKQELSLAEQLSIPAKKQEKEPPIEAAVEIVVDPDAPNRRKLNIPESTTPEDGGTLPHPGDNQKPKKIARNITTDPFAI